MERTVVVGLKDGLHARPAALFVKEAGRQPVPVLIARTGGTAVSAASILSVLTLDVWAGDVVVLSTEVPGPQAEASLTALEHYLTQDAPA